MEFFSLSPIVGPGLAVPSPAGMPSDGMGNEDLGGGAAVEFAQLLSGLKGELALPISENPDLQEGQVQVVPSESTKETQVRADVPTEIPQDPMAWTEEMARMLAALGIALPQPQQLLQKAPELMAELQNSNTALDLNSETPAEFVDRARSEMRHILEKTQIPFEIMDEAQALQVTQGALESIEDWMQAELSTKMGEANQATVSQKQALWLSVPMQLPTTPSAVISQDPMLVGSPSVPAASKVNPESSLLGANSALESAFNPVLDQVESVGKTPQNLVLEQGSAWVAQSGVMKDLWNQLRARLVEVKSVGDVNTQTVQDLGTSSRMPLSTIQLVDQAVAQNSTQAGVELPQTLAPIVPKSPWSDNRNGNTLEQGRELAFKVAQGAELPGSVSLHQNLMNSEDQASNPDQDNQDPTQQFVLNDLRAAEKETLVKSDFGQEFLLAETKSTRMGELISPAPLADSGLARKETPDAPPAQQVSKQVLVQVAAGVQQMRLVLSPESLGEVEITIQVENDHVALHVAVDNPEAKQALEKDIGQLRSQLESQNLKLDKVEVQMSLDQHRREDGMGSSFAGDGRGQGRRNGRSQLQESLQTAEINHEQQIRPLWMGYNRTEFLG